MRKTILTTKKKYNTIVTMNIGLKIIVKYYMEDEVDK